MKLSNETVTEQQRIANLLSYSACDSTEEDDFNSLVRLSAMLCETPIALITFVDEKKLRIKAKYGWDVSELERMGSFCTKAIEEKEMLFISDTLFHTRFSTRPLVVNRSEIHFYLGIPLITQEGFAIGTLCVMDYVPRQLDPRKVSFLKMLAVQVVSLLERNRYQHENQVQKKMLKASAKLAALGALAASIVHEINNPLSILQARATLLGAHTKSGKATPEKILETSAKMLETTRRISTIIRGLSAALGDGDQEAFQETDLGQLIDETLSFVEGRFIGAQIEFEYIPPNDSIVLVCKPIQISQVLINLLNNAYDAAAATRLKRKWVRLKAIDLGDKIVISVSDAGRSLSPEIAHKIFTPFFTTKEVGKGTGLGLSISEEIVKAHHGELKLDTNAKNTTFTVHLPKKQS